MVDTGSILIADDESAFLDSTSELLIRQGHRCDCAVDADHAIDMLRENRYDLLIADIHMPGNDRLELVQQARRLAKEMSVILVTGYPSTDTAIPAIRLSVDAYLKKPVKFAELKGCVQAAVAQSKARRMAPVIRGQLEACIHQIDDFEQVIEVTGGTPATKVLGEYTSVIVRTLTGIVTQIAELEAEIGSSDTWDEVWEGLICPQRHALEKAIQETISVLEETKTKFKSKRLRDLRVRLEQLLKVN